MTVKIMTYAYPIIHSIYDRFRGLPGKLASLTDKTDDWYRSHGYEPKTVNPSKNGNMSAVDHYMRYARLYEAAMPASGRLLNTKVYEQLASEFDDRDISTPQADIHADVITETCDVSKWLARFSLETADRRELVIFEDECDQAVDAILEAKGKARVRRRQIEIQSEPVSFEAREQGASAVAEFKKNGRRR